MADPEIIDAFNVKIGQLLFTYSPNDREMYIIRLASEDPFGDGDHTGTASEIWEDVWAGFHTTCAGVASDG